ncbi:MAG: ABC transporter ATP-binding protein [Phycisphaerales bacterium]|nr:ABC transporter ATP-binding protein [Phycisphaerales bacterium]
MTAIRLEGLAKHYGETAAVAGVTLSVPSGSLFFLLGPSGCGKTTLLRMIAGFIEPTAGRIFFDSTEVTATPPNARNTGMVFQNYALWPHMSVAENVAFGLDVRSIAKAEKERRVREALALVRMQDYATRKPGELSGGQQQRVALARAVVIEPQVLLLDEPLSNLDAKLRIEMRHEIRRIVDTLKVTTVYVTHDQKEALSLADGMAVLNAGSIAQLGAPRELYRRPNSRFVADFLGESNFIEAVRTESYRWNAQGVAMHSSVACDASSATLSLRPEALRMSTSMSTSASAGVNVLHGRLLSSAYLGEVAQHVVHVEGVGELKVFELNPRDAQNIGSTITLSIDPDDVVPISDAPLPHEVVPSILVGGAKR